MFPIENPFTGRIPLVTTRYRITAFVLAAFCFVSAGRGFVPTLCLNWGDLLTTRLVAQDDAECATLTAAHACCAKRGANTQDSAPRQGTKTDAKCPFCQMAKALVEVPEVFRIAWLPEPVADAFRDPDTPHTPCAAAAPRNRAPPLAFALPA